MHFRPISVSRIASLSAAALALSACTVSTPASISSVQTSQQSFSQVELLSEADETGLRARFIEQLNRALPAKGIAVKSGADFVADFAISQREVDVSLQPVTETNEGQGPNEPEFKSRWYHACKPHRVSASLVVYSRASGAIAAKSSGEFLTCPGDLSQLDDLASLLADRVTAQ